MKTFAMDYDFFEPKEKASYATGILIGSICNNLKNKSKTAGGLIWHYQ
jgi:hypothetical protein